VGFGTGCSKEIKTKILVMKTLNIKDAAIVTVRNSSSRLPNKAIMKIKDQLRSIDIVISRAKKTGFAVIIATSTDETDDVFEEIAKEHNVQLFRGALVNKIKRWYDCFQKFKVENAVILDGDDLARSYDIGKRAVDELKRKQLEYIENPPNIITGFFTCAFTKKAITKLYNIVPNENTNTDVITRFVEKANLKIDYVTLEDFERDTRIRLTLDYEEDLEFFRALYNEIDILASGKTIIDFLKKHGNLIQINIGRQKDFLENQRKFNEEIK